MHNVARFSHLLANDSQIMDLNYELARSHVTCTVHNFWNMKTDADFVAQ